MYHKPPESFVSRTRLEVAKADELLAERAADEGSEASTAVTSADVVRAHRSPMPSHAISALCTGVKDLLQAVHWVRDTDQLPAPVHGLCRFTTVG